GAAPIPARPYSCRRHDRAARRHRGPPPRADEQAGQRTRSLSRPNRAPGRGLPPPRPRGGGKGKNLIAAVLSPPSCSVKWLAAMLGRGEVPQLLEHVPLAGSELAVYRPRH